MNGKYTVISLFAGCGGSSLGYKLANYKELLAIEYDKKASEIFKLNFPEVPLLVEDIKKININELIKKFNLKELDILDGSPPCQGFSMSGKRKINDDRNNLYKYYINFINELKPKIFIMENVLGMIRGKMKGLFKIILNDLIETNYNIKVKILNSMWYDVPQSRERLFFIGVRKDINNKNINYFPIPNKKIITCEEALKNCDIGEVKYLKGKRAIYENKLNIGESLNKYVKNKYFNTIKLHPNRPSPTIPKLFGEKWGSFIQHYNRVSSISINELKRLSSFPDDFKLIGNFKDKWAVIGNAVMPIMMKAIAENIKKEILIKN